MYKQCFKNTCRYTPCNEVGPCVSLNKNTGISYVDLAPIFHQIMINKFIEFNTKIEKEVMAFFDFIGSMHIWRLKSQCMIRVTRTVTDDI